MDIMSKLAKFVFLVTLFATIFAFPLAKEEVIEIGRQASAEVERQYELCYDKNILDKVDEIGKTIAAVSDDPALPWTFKVVVSPEVNAFALPGGFIYITTGLLSFVRTDDELAGVIAHEIAHVARYHFVKLLERQSKVQRELAPFLLASLLGAKSGDLENIFLGLQLLEIAKMHSYGQELEEDADLGGAKYLILTKKYNPVGLLTFLQRLARIEERGVKQELGILQTHPYAKERANTMFNYLKSSSVEINERKAAGLFKLVLQPVDNNGILIYMDDQPIVKLSGKEGRGAGEAFVHKLDNLLNQNLRVWEVTAKRLDNGNPAVVARREVLIEISPDIMPDKGQDPFLFAQTIAGNIRHRLMQEFLNQIY